MTIILASMGCTSILQFHYIQTLRSYSVLQSQLHPSLNCQRLKEPLLFDYTHRCQSPRRKSLSRLRISDPETYRDPSCRESISQMARACIRYGTFSITQAPPQVS